MTRHAGTRIGRVLRYRQRTRWGWRRVIVWTKEWLAGGTDR